MILACTTSEWPLLWGFSWTLAQSLSTTMAKNLQWHWAVNVFFEDDYPMMLLGPLSTTNKEYIGSCLEVLPKGWIHGLCWRGYVKSDSDSTNEDPPVDDCYAKIINMMIINHPLCSRIISGHLQRWIHFALFLNETKMINHYTVLSTFYDHLHTDHYQFV